MTSRAGLSNLWPTGRMHYALATPMPGLVKGRKVPIHHVMLSGRREFDIPALEDEGENVSNQSIGIGLDLCFSIWAI